MTYGEEMIAALYVEEPGERARPKMNWRPRLLSWTRLWDFTFKDVCTKYWTNWCIRVHITVVTRQLCHPGTIWKDDNNARGELFDSSDCHCKRNSCCFLFCFREFCLMLDQVLLCSTDSECCEGVGEGEKQKRWFGGATKSSNRYCAFILWFQTCHIAEFPLIWV